jgi:hypothetical protein
MVLDGRVGLSIILSSPHSGPPIRYTLQVILMFLCRLDGPDSPLHPAAAQHGSHLMVLDGCVDLSIIISSPHSRRPIRYTLQVILMFLCRLDGLYSPLHPAAA